MKLAFAATYEITVNGTLDADTVDQATRLLDTMQFIPQPFPMKGDARCELNIRASRLTPKGFSFRQLS